MPTKISREFNTRLQSLLPEGKVRALVLLAVGMSAATRSSRPTREERRATAGAVRQAAMGTLSAIEEILAHHEGRRLATAGSLGTIPVETTAEGIRALAASDEVRAILEDQKMRRV